ncbi:type I methionyl aminopeptidase [Rhabdothermincola salaria]|uniref:type I methionyl aminopeptidase n=1 Tax=Rhabdothermincola salaria TaxID=2903142 RepID=UPI001E527CF9|nr:type I methionyl aminopeptidase [Rhabdothermincola salaria]
MKRTPEQIRLMRAAGRVVAEMHDEIRRAVRPGVTTLQLDAIGRTVLERRGATSNFLGYHGYPAVICASPNDTIVHGIPSDRALVDGDILSIDCGAVVDGWHGDAAFTMAVGEVSPEAERLIEVTRASLFAGIAAMRDGKRLGDVGAAVQRTVEAAGFSVVREYVGHGIGTAMHEKPEVPNVGVPGKGGRLKPGMTLALEPMVNVGAPETFLTDDGWTVVTADRSLSAHWEHTVLVTEGEPEILTAA